MARVVFISSTRGWQSPRDRLGEVFAGILLCLVVYSAASAGWKSGGLIWAMVYGGLAFVSFPIFLTIGTLLCLAMLPILAFPGTLLANLLGWTSYGPYAVQRFWLQRISTILILIPLIFFAQAYALTLIALMGGIITVGLILFGLFVVLPLLILTGVAIHFIRNNASSEGSSSTVQWKKPDPPLLPPPGDQQ